MNEIYWDTIIETLDLNSIKNLQVEKLKHLIKHAKENSPYYKNILKTVDISQIRTIDDISLLPFTDAYALIENPLQFKSCKEICRVHCSGGTVTSPKISSSIEVDLTTSLTLSTSNQHLKPLSSQ